MIINRVNPVNEHIFRLDYSGGFQSPQIEVPAFLKGLGIKPSSIMYTYLNFVNGEGTVEITIDDESVMNLQKIFK
jgi:hypothetical protein